MASDPFEEAVEKLVAERKRQFENNFHEAGKPNRLDFADQTRFKPIEIPKSECVRLNNKKGMAFVGGNWQLQMSMVLCQSPVIKMVLVPETNKCHKLQTCASVYRDLTGGQYSWAITAKLDETVNDYFSKGYSDFFECQQACLLYLLELQNSTKGNSHD